MEYLTALVAVVVLAAILWGNRPLGPVMNVRQEIKKHAAKEDKKVLNWLLDNYSRSDKWRFVTKCKFESYGKYSYQANRIWSPTKEGRVLYEAMSKKGD